MLPLTTLALSVQPRILVMLSCQPSIATFVKDCCVIRELKFGEHHERRAQRLKEDIPAPLKLRDMIEEMAVKELHGPVGGEEEEVDERIRDRYLVGILATQQRDDHQQVSQDDLSTESEEDDISEGDFPPVMNLPSKELVEAI